MVTELLAINTDTASEEEADMRLAGAIQALLRAKNEQIKRRNAELNEQAAPAYATAEARRQQAAKHRRMLQESAERNCQAEILEARRRRDEALKAALEIYHATLQDIAKDFRAETARLDAASRREEEEFKAEVSETKEAMRQECDRAKGLIRARKAAPQ